VSKELKILERQVYKGEKQDEVRVRSTWI